MSDSKLRKRYLYIQLESRLAAVKASKALKNDLRQLALEVSRKRAFRIHPLGEFEEESEFDALQPPIPMRLTVWQSQSDPCRALVGPKRLRFGIKCKGMHAGSFVAGNSSDLSLCSELVEITNFIETAELCDPEFEESWMQISLRPREFPTMGSMSTTLAELEILATLRIRRVPKVATTARWNMFANLASKRGDESSSLEQMLEENLELSRQCVREVQRLNKKMSRATIDVESWGDFELESNG